MAIIVRGRLLRGDCYCSIFVIRSPISDCGDAGEHSAYF